MDAIDRVRAYVEAAKNFNPKWVIAREGEHELTLEDLTAVANAASYEREDRE